MNPHRYFSAHNHGYWTNVTVDLEGVVKIETLGVPHSGVVAHHIRFLNKHDTETTSLFVDNQEMGERLLAAAREQLAEYMTWVELPEGAEPPRAFEYTEVIVSAGTSFNHPFEQYANFSGRALSGCGSSRRAGWCARAAAGVR